MTYSYLCYDSFKSVTWLSHTSGHFKTHPYVCHDFICVPWPIHMCAWLIHTPQAILFWSFSRGVATTGRPLKIIGLFCKIAYKRDLYSYVCCDSFIPHRPFYFGVSPVDTSRGYAHPVRCRERAADNPPLLRTTGGIACCNVLRWIAMCCSVLQFIAVWCSVSQCVAVCCSVLQCAAVCYSVLQCATVCCSALQCVPECSSVFQCVACADIYMNSQMSSVPHCIAGIHTYIQRRIQ